MCTSAGQPTLLTCEARGTPAHSITWHEENVIVKEPDYIQLRDGSLYIANTILQDERCFTVMAANLMGMVKKVINVTVADPSPPKSK